MQFRILRFCVSHIAWPSEAKCVSSFFRIGHVQKSRFSVQPVGELLTRKVKGFRKFHERLIQSVSAARRSIVNNVKRSDPKNKQTKKRVVSRIGHHNMQSPLVSERFIG